MSHHHGISEEAWETGEYLRDLWQDEQVKKSEDIYWVCPECDTINLDNPNYTTFPLCSNCDKEYHWDEVEDFVE